MTDIPREIMEEARKLVDELHGSAAGYADAYYHMRIRREGAYQRAAERLLSRDKRAAEIAETHRKRYNRGHDMANVYRAVAAREIHDSILRYDTSTTQEDKPCPKPST